MNSAMLGFVRGLGTVILFAVLTYVSDASHLNSLLGVSLATLISAVAMALEHKIESTTGNALFGAVRAR